MSKLSSLLWGLGLGAGLMYFNDPQQGNRRKALVRDKVTGLKNKGDEAVDVVMRDVRNKTRGVLYEGISLVSEDDAPDYIIEKRVRSQLSFLTRHPRAIEVSVQNGEVTFSGDVLAEEADQLIGGISKMRGVKRVNNNLHVHQDAGNIPQLQGTGWMPGDNDSGMWSPTTRAIVGITALYLVLYGFVRGGIVGFLARASGLVLGTRALTNMDMGRMTGMTERTDAISVRKGLTINAPVQEVYGLWSNFENFPKFMTNVESIRDIGNGRSHWVVKGPAGTKVEFDANVVENTPNQKIAWETTKDSMIKHHGQVVFKEAAKNKTQLNVNMSYTPPAGVAGHAVASLFGRDPKSEMDADLVRMKSLLEEGKTRSEGKKVTREEVMPVTGDEGKKKGKKGGQSEQDRDYPSGSGDPYGEE